jgi:hypothetical protein
MGLICRHDSDFDLNVRCNSCGKHFNEMDVGTVELSYRLFTDCTHEFNESAHIKLCDECAPSFLNIVRS